MDKPEEKYSQQQAAQQQAMLLYQQLASANPMALQYAQMPMQQQMNQGMDHKPFIPQTPAPPQQVGPPQPQTQQMNLQMAGNPPSGVGMPMAPPNLVAPNSAYGVPPPGANFGAQMNQLNQMNGQGGVVDMAAIQKQQQQLMMSIFQNMAPGAPPRPPPPGPMMMPMFRPPGGLGATGSGRLENPAPQKMVTPIAMKTPGMSPPGQEDEPPHMKRSAHIAAEQKRRNNIKVGFQDLQQMLPSYKAKGPAQKLSKSAVLFQALDYVNQLQQQKNDLALEVAKLQNESLSLKTINMKFQQVAAMQPSGMGGVGSFDGNRADSPEQIKFLLFKTFVDKLYGTFEDGVRVDSLEALQGSLYTWLDGNVQTEKLQHMALESVSEVSMKVFHNRTA